MAHQHSMILRNLISCALLIAFAFTSATHAFGQAKDREAKVRGDQSRILKDGFWIYNDLPKGLQRAKESGKPVLVIFRCIPCEACAQLDESVVEDNLRVRKLLSQFVPVRIVHTNGMDMHKFQFDYDQSWAAFILHADGTIIGRYGTRSHQTESDQDVSLEGFLDSLRVALELHKQFDSVKPMLLAKTGPQAPVDRPEQFPGLKEKYGSSLDYEGKVVASCIHCHQVGEALFTSRWKEARRENKPLLPETIFPYPNPKILGLVMDPQQARVAASISESSAAAKAGLKAGDEIVSCEGQPIISTADIQWVLHHVGDRSSVELEARRGDQLIKTRLELVPGWRDADDIAWRVGSWQLRRMLTGGLKLDAISADDPAAAKLQADAIGLRVKHVGQFAPHDRAKRAGFKEGDILVSIGDWKGPLTESQLLVKRLREGREGDSLPVTLLRGEKTLTLTLPEFAP